MSRPCPPVSDAPTPLVELEPAALAVLRDVVARHPDRRLRVRHDGFG